MSAYTGLVGATLYSGLSGSSTRSRSTANSSRSSMRERADAYLPHKLIHLAASSRPGGGVSAVPRCRRAAFMAANSGLGAIIWTTPLDEQRIDAVHSHVSAPPNLGKLAYSPISRSALRRPP